MYKFDDILVFLINISNSFIKKQISDRAVMLAYSKYFLACLRFCLTRARKGKGTEDDWTIGFIWDIFAGIIFVANVFAEAVFTEATFTENTFISVKLSNISF